MSVKEIDQEAPFRIPRVPQCVLDDVLAGLDDMQHGRSVPGDVVLVEIDKKLADWRAKNNRGGHGTNSSDRTAADR